MKKTNLTITDRVYDSLKQSGSITKCSLDTIKIETFPSLLKKSEEKYFKTKDNLLNEPLYCHRIVLVHQFVVQLILFDLYHLEIVMKHANNVL